eukprot:s1601_g7.t1
MSEGEPASDDAVHMDTSDVAVADDGSATSVPTGSPSESEMEIESPDPDAESGSESTEYSEVSAGPHQADVAAGVGPPSVPTTLDSVGPVLPGSHIYVHYHTHNHWTTTAHNHYHSHAVYKNKYMQKHITKHIHVQVHAGPPSTASSSTRAVLDANDDGAHNGENGAAWPRLTAAPAHPIDLMSDSDYDDSDSDVVLEHDRGSRDNTRDGDPGDSHESGSSDDSSDACEEATSCARGSCL